MSGLMVTKLYKSLATFVEKLRENYNELEETATEFADNPTYQSTKKVLNRGSNFFDESPSSSTETPSLSPKDLFKTEKNV